MKRTTSLLILFLFFAFASKAGTGKTFEVNSPDGKIKVEISVNDNVKYSVLYDGHIMISPSAVSMELIDGSAFGIQPKLKRTSRRSVDETIPTVAYQKKQVRNYFNELTLSFKGDYQLIFRAYNDGSAYRFVSTGQKPFEVKSEQAEFAFPSDFKAYIPYVREDRTHSFEEQFFNSFENTYTHTSLSQWDKRKYAFTPVLIEGSNGEKICIVESDLMDYPGMYLYNGDGSTTLKGVFAPYPKETKQGGHNNLQDLVVFREDYIAKCSKGTKFPWRAAIITDDDAKLADNDMVYRLASPQVDEDFSWVKPGKVAWDWWNDWNLYGVDFKAGVNNETYKYYIDFASKYGIEYVILDEGWAVNLKADLFQVVPEINLKELVDYAAKKNVGLILWAGYYAFNRDMDKVCKYYSELGIKGFKVDFMNRDDQLMVDFVSRAAETCAKYKLLIDFHGMYKPTGLYRTYPNAINFEGVHGLEQMKWSATDVDQVTYDVTIPFTRMVAGPMDYTQGAMRNATKANYRPVNSEPMSQGTRCHQLAEYVVFESPLDMMCDSPSNYEKEDECTRFISRVPTTWDETRALNGKVAEYVTIARKKGDEWYVGSLNNWDARDLEIDLSFLGRGIYFAEIFKDGLNADKAARDYKKEIIPVPADRKLKIHMAPGGGWVARIYQPKVVAHRGYHTLPGAAENSIASLKNAQELGIYGSEFDVWITTNGVLYVNHDGKIDGKIIQNSTSAEIENCTLSNGEKIPTLKAYLEQGKKVPHVKMILEIKPHYSVEKNRRIADSVVAMIKSEDMTGQVEFISFDYEVCKQVAAQLPGSIVGYLKGDKTPETVLADGIKSVDYSMSAYRQHENWINEAHRSGMVVNVWTVDSDENLNEFINQGVDMITTNHPDRLRELLEW
ncbi:MAG: glycoside hydrolase family 97 catalytic domain-containing protein [Mangrovibacterium sp.]